MSATTEIVTSSWYPVDAFVAQPDGPTSPMFLGAPPRSAQSEWQGIEMLPGLIGCAMILLNCFLFFRDQAAREEDAAIARLERKVRELDDEVHVLSDVLLRQIESVKKDAVERENSFGASLEQHLDLVTSACAEMIEEKIPEREEFDQKIRKLKEEISQRFEAVNAKMIRAPRLIEFNSIQVGREAFPSESIGRLIPGKAAYNYLILDYKCHPQDLERLVTHVSKSLMAEGAVFRVDVPAGYVCKLISAHFSTCGHRESIPPGYVVGVLDCTETFRRFFDE